MSFIDATVIVPTLGRLQLALDLGLRLDALDPAPVESVFVFQREAEFAEWTRINRTRNAKGLFCSRQGANFARNFGAASATSRFLVFLDDDCFPVHENWLEELLSPLTQPSVVLSTGRVLGWSKASGQIPRLNRAFLLSPLFLQPWGNPAATRSGYCQTVAGGNFAIEKTLFGRYGGFSERFTSPSLYEETELSKRITTGAPGKIWFSASAAVVHRQSENGGMRLGAQKPTEQFIRQQRWILLQEVYGGAFSSRVRHAMFVFARSTWHFLRRLRSRFRSVRSNYG